MGSGLSWLKVSMLEFGGLARSCPHLRRRIGSLRCFESISMAQDIALRDCAKQEQKEHRIEAAAEVASAFAALRAEASATFAARKAVRALPLDLGCFWSQEDLARPFVEISLQEFLRLKQLEHAHCEELIRYCPTAAREKVNNYDAKHKVVQFQPKVLELAKEFK
ncbi:hypothetical protein AK812_SmicGene16595 [Symbiodinium microadriaticum]|uniref:Uncharacterized protein n=1 Tax=Symbiodinium microadriaticum TaxID=2951 RepID=A0A1Q9DZX5_SYMMI|nr:hypothetical protein AK812_SmicGene16595 [Symbiodinium microadriaticum]